MWSSDIRGGKKKKEQKTIYETTRNPWPAARKKRKKKKTHHKSLSYWYFSSNRNILIVWHNYIDHLLTTLQVTCCIDQSLHVVFLPFIYWLASDISRLSPPGPQLPKGLLFFFWKRIYNVCSAFLCIYRRTWNFLTGLVWFERKKKIYKIFFWILDSKP